MYTHVTRVQIKLYLVIALAMQRLAFVLTHKKTIAATVQRSVGDISLPVIRCLADEVY